MTDDKITQAIYLGVRDAMSFHLASQKLLDDVPPTPDPVYAWAVWQGDHPQVFRVENYAINCQRERGGRIVKFEVPRE